MKLNSLMEKLTSKSSYTSAVLSLFLLYAIFAGIEHREIVHSLENPSAIWGLLAFDMTIIVLFSVTFFRNIGFLSLLVSMPIYFIMGNISTEFFDSRFEPVIMLLFLFVFNLAMSIFKGFKAHRVFPILFSSLILVVGFLMHQILFSSAFDRDIQARSGVYKEISFDYKDNQQLTKCDMYEVKCITFSKFEMDNQSLNISQEISGIVEAALTSPIEMYDFAKRSTQIRSEGEAAELEFSFKPYYYHVWYEPKSDNGLIIIDRARPEFVTDINVRKYNLIFSIFVFVWLFGGTYAYRQHQR